MRPPAPVMHKALPVLVFVVAAVAGHGCSSPSPVANPADLIVTNAHVYTVNPQQPRAEAVAVRGGVISAVGTAAEVDAQRGPSTEVIDAAGQVVLPGLTDTHVHFIGGAEGRQRVMLDDATTVEEIQRRVKAYADAHPDAPWILGGGWYYSVFGEAALPDRRLLDAVVADRPVFLMAYDFHSSWANSKALELAGITARTPDPVNGAIVRDPRTRAATGALKETAGGLIEKAIPPTTREQRLEALRQGIRYANAFGLTRVHSAGGDAEVLDLFAALRAENALTLRLLVAPNVQPPAATPDVVTSIETLRTAHHDAFLDVGAVKFMLDGVIEAHTASVLEPYADAPESRGTLNWDPSAYAAAVADFDRRGFQIFTHAIGDRAIRVALDAYEAAAPGPGRADRRFRVEHIESPAAADIPRFGALGVIASMQPLHATPGDNNLNVWSKAIGPERASRAWPWQRLASGGARLALGSDWPVVTLDPWQGLRMLRLRQTLDGKPPGGWLPDERVSIEAAVRGYTIDAAFAGRLEKTEGSLETGKVGDLVILSQDIFAVAPDQLAKTTAVVTVVGGRVVHDARR
jgi:predicted amidohydrolase YtcJ